jgi:hypothetical protein
MERYPALRLPEWQWTDKRLSFASMLLGMLAYFVPLISGIANRVWLIAGVVLISLVLVIPMFKWTARTCVVLVARAKSYPQVAAYAKEQNIKLLEANRRLSSAMPLDYRFEIHRVLFDQHSKMYVVIKKRQDFHLAVGDKLWIVDMADLEDSVEQRILGTFQVSEVRTDDYYACEVNVTKSWGELFRNEGRAEMMPTPNTEAVRAPTNEQFG